MWHLFKDFMCWIKDIPREIKYFCQRGKRGYSDRDTWGLDFYLAEVISNSIAHLQKYNHGYPVEVGSPEKWEEILATISKTFKTALEISSTESFYTPSHFYNTLEFIKHRKTLEKITKELQLKFPNHRCKILTLEECLEYEEGWKLFQKYFFGLWD